MYLIKESSTDPAVRLAATEQVARLQEWFVALQYREDVYRVVKTFSDAYESGRGTRLRGEDRKLYEDTMRDFRRAGLHLDPATRARVEDLKKQLARVSTEFDTNITSADVTIEFTKAELDGVPEQMLASFPMQGDRFVLRPTVITNFLAVMNNAKREETRKRMKIARFSVAQEQNAPILNEMVRLRQEIAAALGYATWADYQIEPRMAKTGARALAFCEDAKRGLDPKFVDEIAQMRAMKINDTGDTRATIQMWDWRYYENQLKKAKYDVDAEALRVYFPLDRSLAGMFSLRDDLLHPHRPDREPQPMAPGVTSTPCRLALREPLGLFYLDMFPREGKYNHFAQFGIIDGKLLSDGVPARGRSRLPSPPQGDRPSLLSHQEVRPFYEFGHAAHDLTRASTSRSRAQASATSSALPDAENWVWDMGVLNSFAADYRARRTIPPELLARMEAANSRPSGPSTGASWRSRSATCAAHGHRHARRAGVNGAMAEVFLRARGHALRRVLGPPVGLRRGYYGCVGRRDRRRHGDAVLRRGEGLMDRRVGMAARAEIYAVGGSRDVESSARSSVASARTRRSTSLGIGVEVTRQPTGLM